MKAHRWLWVVLFCACQTQQVTGGSYYQERIEPIFQVGCQITTSGCHIATDVGSAPGNLDLSSYDSLRRRTDLLMPYGPYSLPLLLLKGTEGEVVQVDTHDAPDAEFPEVRSVRIHTDIRHAGGSGLAQGSRERLQRWLTDGFARNGTPRDETGQNTGECSPGPGNAPGFSAANDPNAALFAAFVENVQPVLTERCAGGGCHGAALADFHLSCGETESEQRWNFWISTQFVGMPVERSEFLMKPLGSIRGGFHGGGETFPGPGEPDYLAMQSWSQRLATEAPELVREGDVSEGYRFFVNRVEPVLVAKGCMALACHSPLSVAFHLRGGAGGSFSRLARGINYRLSKALLAVDSPDPNQSRIIGKNLLPVDMLSDGEGMIHRGGSLFENGSTPSAESCEGVDADHGDLNEIPAYCVMRRWHQIERAEGIAAGQLDDDLRGMVWVTRPLGIGEASDFDTYRPGADLRFATASTASGIPVLGASQSLLAPCGIDPVTADVRRPRASWDGRLVAFAARASAVTPLRLYEVNPATGACSPIEGAATERERDGVLMHDFDPAYAPDGTLVFASTRGLAQGRPTRTAASLAPNADLYVLNRGSGELRQLTFLINQEFAPGFLPDGRVIYTLEKRELDFHMLALRRQNLDGGDFHPLYASRDSLGFNAATDVAMMPNGNGAFIAAPLGAIDGAGALVTFNRTVGPDQEGRDISERGYMPSMGTHVPSVFRGGTGVYRSPSPLPSGELLASCALELATVPTAPIDFDVCVVDPNRGGVRRLFGEPGVAELDAIALYARPNRGILVSDGEGIDRPLIEAGAIDAVVQFNDFPMIQSLMFRNTREGRPLDFRIGGFEVLEHHAPPAGATDFGSLGGVVTDSYGRFYSSSESLGWVPLYADGSTVMRLRGGITISFLITDSDGNPLEMAPDLPFSGPAMQREHEQYYPGERIKRSIPRRFFNTTCGGCHGSITGRELDVSIDIDVVTGASDTLARGTEPFDLMD